MEKRKKRKAEGDLRERFCRRWDLLPDLLRNEGLVELRGQCSATVRGGGKILLYTPEEIRISLPSCVLSLRGEGLICTSYYQGAIGVEGRICGVFFEGEE